MVREIWERGRGGERERDGREEEVVRERGERRRGGEKEMGERTQLPVLRL